MLRYFVLPLLTDMSCGIVSSRKLFSSRDQNQWSRRSGNPSGEPHRGRDDQRHSHGCRRRQEHWEWGEQAAGNRRDGAIVVPESFQFVPSSSSSDSSGTRTHWLGPHKECSKSRTDEETCPESNADHNWRLLCLLDAICFHNHLVRDRSVVCLTDEQVIQFLSFHVCSQ